MSSISINNMFSIILLLFVLCGQSFAQWQKTNLPDTVKINTIAMKGSDVFAGTNGAGIFLSTDNGESWSSINEGLQSKIIHSIMIQGNNIFAGTETGVSISTDNGINWNTINSGLSGKGVWSFALNNYMGDTTVFAGTWSGIYTSTDNGTNWIATSLSTTTMPVHSIVIHNNFIFAATMGSGIFSSHNNGFVWNDISIKYYDKSTGNISILPVYSLAVIDTNIIASAGQGDFYCKSDHDTLFSVFYPGIKSTKPVLCHAVRGAALFAGNSIGEIFSSDPIGLHWERISYPLMGNVIYSIVLNQSYIFAGTDNGIWRLWYPESNTATNDFKETTTCFALEQNYPNPFNPSTVISYHLPAGRQGYQWKVTLKVYNLLGEEIETLVNEYQNAGFHSSTFTVHSSLPSGIYFYQLRVSVPTGKAGDFIQTKEMILIK